ncbi:hypothetical protein HDU98_011674 [Podochytrium sp. JEL0797]|nr:hypothetical protein HDU98_011674 [Podochytrium sp. JEL0797]
MTRSRSKGTSRSASASSGSASKAVKDFKVLRPDSFSQGSLYLREPPPEPVVREPHAPLSSSSSARTKAAAASGVPRARAVSSSATTPRTSTRPSSSTTSSTAAPKTTRSLSQRSGLGVSTGSTRPMLRSQALLSPTVSLQKEIVIVTSRGTFIVKAGSESSISWALEVASDLMMAANPTQHNDDSSRVVLVAARTGSGLVASEDHLVFTVCREDKILFAITADETTNIPPSFAHAFAANPITPDELSRATALLRRRDAPNSPSPPPPAPVMATPPTSPSAALADAPASSPRKKSPPSMDKFSSRIRMSVAMNSYVDDLDKMVQKMEKTEQDQAAAVAVAAEEVAAERRRRTLAGSEFGSGASFSSFDEGNAATRRPNPMRHSVQVSAVTMLNPFGAETEADVVIDGDEDDVLTAMTGSSGTGADVEYNAPPKVPVPATAAEKLSRRLTRASALSILMDILPAMPSMPTLPFLSETPKMGDSPSTARKTLQIANPDSDDESPAPASVKRAASFSVPSISEENEEDGAASSSFFAHNKIDSGSATKMYANPPMPSVGGGLSKPSLPLPSVAPPSHRRSIPKAPSSVPGWMTEEEPAAAAVVVAAAPAAPPAAVVAPPAIAVSPEPPKEAVVPVSLTPVVEKEEVN